MRTTLINLTVALAFVAIMFNVSFAADPATDSVQVTDSLGNQIYVLITQDVVDSLAKAGNTSAAVTVGVRLELQKQAEAARKQAVADSLAQAKEKAFWTEVDSTLKVMPRNPRLAVDSIDWDQTSQATAYFMLFGLDSAEARVFAGNSTDLEINMSVLMSAYIDQEIRRRTVELGGPAHSRLIKQTTDLVKQDSILNDQSRLNDACLASLDSTMAETREGVQYNYSLITTNSDNINTLGGEVNTLKTNVWKAMEMVKRAKLNGEPKDENLRLIEELDEQSDAKVEMVALKN